MKLWRTLSGIAIALISVTPPVHAQAPSERPPYLISDATTIVLKNVRLFDGERTREAQTIVIENGRISSFGPSVRVEVPARAETFDLKGRTVMPGLVMMHEHLMYFSGRAVWHSQPVSYPRLYLAAGITTVRTAGTEHPEVELNLKRRIDEGRTPGPKLLLTSPIINGPGSEFLGDTVVTSPEQARAVANFWADRGFTAFKVYDAITPEQLSAIVEVADARKMKVAGHLKSVGCVEAAKLGIDFIEHSFVSCQKDLGVNPEAPGFKADINSPQVKTLIGQLVKAGVVMVATPFNVDRKLSTEELATLSPPARQPWMEGKEARPAWLPDPASHKEIRKLERAFVAAGGKLALGADPTDFGQIAGYANHRAMQLMVDAGWTPTQVLQMTTSGAAKLLGLDKNVGRIAKGHAADLVVLKGDPTRKIADITNVEMVLKDGVPYDPAKLRGEAKGMVGWH